MLATEEELASQIRANDDLHHRRTCLVVIYGVAREDPPASRTIEFLTSQGYRINIVQLAPADGSAGEYSQAVKAVTVHMPDIYRIVRPFYNWLRWRRFVAKVRTQVARTEPQLVIAIMLHAMAALPNKVWGKRPKVVMCVYDIPSLQDSGKLDHGILQRGRARLSEADIVWASDVYKAHLAQDLGGLSTLPLVCHNCPSANYLPDSLWPRDGSLRSELRKLGASIGEADGSILLRAGAVGEWGGIEETLEAMRELPENYIFVMMGRPTIEYKQKIQFAISKLNLGRRAFLWDRPTDEFWRIALLGADIGHLIHGPFPPGRMTRLYEMNSSLSTNRLFQFMAAGLPIISHDDPRMSEIYGEVPCFRIARLSHLKDDILAAWRDLVGDTILRTRLGLIGRRAHLDKYCWEKQFGPVLNAIET